MESSREARRRRILERGSDRLALIAGRIQTLPSSSSPPSSSPRLPDEDPRYPLPSPSSVPPHGEDSFCSTLPKSDSSTETGHLKAYNGGSGVDEASKAPALGLDETLKAPALETNHIKESPVGSSTIQESSVSTVDTHQQSDTRNEASKAPALGLDETLKAPALETNRIKESPVGSSTIQEASVSTVDTHQQSDTSNEASKAPALGLDETLKAPALETNRIKESPVGIKEPPVGSSTIQESSVSTVDTHQQSELRTHQHRFFTPAQISSAVAASESTRILCSVATALLVVLSNLGFPGLGSNIIKGITATRPPYLLLLANLTVVLARLLSDKQGGSTRAGKMVNKAPLESGNGWADQVGRALEASLLLQKVVDSVFMDCSFYAIVVICGLCLGNLFSL